MQSIQLRDAKATFSAVVNDAIEGRPAMITRHGKPAAVVISIMEWERLNKQVPSFGAYLMSAPELIGDLPPRDQTPMRSIDF